MPESITGEDLIDTSTVTLELLNKQDKTVQKIILNNAWVKSIGEITTSWDSENEISKFSLTMRYDWLVEEPVSGQEGETSTI